MAAGRAGGKDSLTLRTSETIISGFGWKVNKKFAVFANLSGNLRKL
jgi:hypothetical protein